MVARNKDSLRLEEFKIEGLFGEFNHSIPMQPAARITALIGPNGVGKTVCLKLINALFRKNWSAFNTTEFSTIEFRFSDGSTVTVDRAPKDAENETVSGDDAGVRFLTTADDMLVPEQWRPRIVDDSQGRGRNIEAYVPFLTRVAANRWVHDVSRQVFTFQEVIENFRDRLPESFIDSVSDRPAGLLATICDSIDCHLIETQRLLVFTSDDYRRPNSSGSTLAISRKAQTLKQVIERELAVYAATSQSLDRSFPKRVLQQGPIQAPADLQANLAELDALRKGLMEAGVLDAESDDALPAFPQISEAIAGVLNVYVQDNKQKLGVLAQLRDRIRLFTKLVDGRFFPKVVTVDKRYGFQIRRNANREVPLEKLSSGEQHQLVLFFELLFELKPNALILIDEPELSLHVAWQKQFIPDLRRIIELNGFDVLLATHSPQLIGQWDELIVDLGDVD